GGGAGDTAHAAGQAAHGAQEAAHGAGQAAGHGGGHGGEFGAETMIHHMVESQTIDLGFTTIDLSPLAFDTFQLFGYPVDLSVTNYVVFLVLAGILTIVTMWYAAKKAREMEQGEEAPGGLLNAFEAFYFFLRDDVALDNIG
ncbi:MAG: hypothetical protein ABEJ46_04915, partial [Gemmatimonadota bacterium]